MVGLLGGMAVKVEAAGVVEAGKKVEKLNTGFTKMHKSLKPKLAALSKGFKKFGLVAGGAMGMLIAASPLLRAKMEVLNIRVQELVRSFEDALVPALELVTDIVKAAIDWWNSLPEPLQEAIIFGMQVAVMLGLLALAWWAVTVASSSALLPIYLIIAAAALLYLAFETNFLGIKTIVEAVIGAIIGFLDLVVGAIERLPKTIEKIFNAVGDVFKVWQDMIQGIIDNIIGIFEGIITFITAIFSGDIEGAIGAIQDIFEAGFQIIMDIIMWPVTALGTLIESLTGTDILGDIMQAGKEIIEAFIKGAQKAIDAAGQVVGDVLEGIGDFLGGSLPERGPLMHVEDWGKDLGAAYTTSIAEGISGNVSTIDRSLHIDSLEMTMEGADMETSEQLFGELKETRRSRAW